MTPGARLAAAVGVLDRWLAGVPAEQALTNWARASRFAGSGDRRAVRDLVFDAVRCRRSFAAQGGAETGRGLVIGGLRAAGRNPADLFTGQGHAPEPLTEAEAAGGREPSGNAALDIPDWVEAPLRAALGAGFAPVAQALRSRAPVFLRVNAARLTREAAQARLAAEGVATAPHPLAKFALQVTGNAERIAQTASFSAGLVELQDAASQAVVEALPLRPGLRVLDLCAGGGGKALAMAALGAEVTAHDAVPARMRDLPARAARAGVRIALTDAPEAAAPFDLVLADVPCSGSGAWRRSPEGKWRLTPGQLDGLLATQAAILDRAAGLVAPGGHLAYATCSLLAAENEAQADAFRARAPAFAEALRRRISPLEGGDGFFLSLLARAR